MSNTQGAFVRQGSNPITGQSSSSTFRLNDFEGEESNNTVANSEGSSSREDSCKMETADTLYFEPRKVYRLANGSPSCHTLTRVYSDSEKKNFDHVMGTRIFDDLRHRPVPSSTKMDISKSDNATSKSSLRYSISERSNKRSICDMQDEYIPEFDFADVINKWQMEDEDNNGLLGINNNRKKLPPLQTRVSNASSIKYMSDISQFNDWNGFAETASGSTSPSSSYVLDSSHAQVQPIPLPNRSTTIQAIGDANTGIMNGLNDENAEISGNDSSLMSPFRRYKPSRRKTTAAGSFHSASSFSSQFPDNTISVITELKMTTEEVTELIEKLPHDFLFMPYSSRKKLIVEHVPNKDYKLIMSLIKKYLLKNSKSSSSIGKSPVVGPFTGVRSRHGSVASQFLSSFSPAQFSSVASMNSIRPDDKGMEIMGHRLGKVIGFGAWGMIRECYDIQTGVVRAMKIVRFRNNFKVKKQVIKEVKIWQQLKNKNILRLLNWKLDEDYAIYCLSEKINDGTLYDLVIYWGEYTQSKVDIRERCIISIKLLFQIISALKYMHSKCIVHGDVKLENCLLDKNSDNGVWRILICDFGMSNYFGHPPHLDTSELSRMNFNAEIDPSSSGSSVEFTSPIDGSKITTCKKPSISRSKSNSNVPTKDYLKNRSISLRNVRSRKVCQTLDHVGVSSIPRNYGPSLTSTRINSLNAHSLKQVSSFSTSRLSPTMDLALTHKKNGNESSCIGPDPNSHIGSLPYAAPELLEPSPPPLGPPADIWALGVMLYTMLTGRLPFKHDYEPRLRATIAAGKYDKDALAIVCGKDNDTDSPVFLGIYDAIIGCLTVDINKRWNLDQVQIALSGDINRT